MRASRSQENATAARLLGRVVLMPTVALCLLAGIVGGLLRAGVTVPDGLSGAWLGPVVAAHAFLMICAFMGTVIGIERAVAVKAQAAFLAPLCSGLAGLVTLAGLPRLGAWLAVAASVVFVAVNVLVVARQRALHTQLLLVGALAWLFGNVSFAFASSPHAVVPWWFAFLVLTIAAERLE